MLKKIILCSLIGVLSILQGNSQDLYITIQDQVDLSYIDAAEIFYLDIEGEVLSQQASNKQGRVLLNPIFLEKTTSIKVSHVGYHSLELDLETVASQHYQIFLENKTYNFNEIVFTANKYQENKEDIPYQIDVVKAQDIQFNNPQSSADLLQQKGSVFVQRSQMGGGSPNLRGFEANKVLIVVDGIRLNNAVFRSGHLQNVITIDPSIIDRTEIMFGPSSVMYGSDALGGVMHFYTKNPELSNTDKTLIKGNVVSRFSSANQEKYVHADISYGRKHWGMLTSISAVDFNDLRVGQNRHDAYPEFGRRNWYVERADNEDIVTLNEDPNRMRFSGYKQLDFLQKFFFLPSTTLSHTLNFQYSTSSEIPRFDRLTQWSNGNPRYAQWSYGPQNRLMASYQLKHTEKNALYDQLSVIGAFQNIQESRITRNFQSDFQNNREETINVFSLNLDANKVVHDHHELAYGLESILNKVGSSAFTKNELTGSMLPLDTRYPDGGSNMNSFAAYFTHRWELNDKITLTDGIRYTVVRLDSRFEDRNFFPFPFTKIQQNNQALSGNIASVFELGRGWRISLLAATGFRAPNLDDVAKVFDSQPGNVVVPNPDLRPEYSYNGEFSISKTIEEILRVEWTGFYTWYTNALVVRDFDLNGEEFIVYEDSLSRVQANVNAKTAFIAGFNNNLYVDLGQVSFSNSMTFTYGQETETGVPMDHIPPFFGKASINYKTKRFRAAFYSLYNGWKRPNRYSPRDENNAEFATEDGWPSWMTLNLKSSYTLTPNLQLQIGIENLLDVHYRPFSSRISAPGRNLIMSVRASL